MKLGTLLLGSLWLGTLRLRTLYLYPVFVTAKKDNCTRQMVQVYTVCTKLYNVHVPLQFLCRCFYCTMESLWGEQKDKKSSLSWYNFRCVFCLSFLGFVYILCTLENIYIKDSHLCNGEKFRFSIFKQSKRTVLCDWLFCKFCRYGDTVYLICFFYRWFRKLGICLQPNTP